MVGRVSGQLRDSLQLAEVVVSDGLCPRHFAELVLITVGCPGAQVWSGRRLSWQPVGR